MRIGILGGSGLYEMKGLTDVANRVIRTPFGKPSDYFICGKLAGCEVIFLPRHGRGHRFMPSEINYRANIFGFKMLGVERILSVSAVGSLKDKLPPGTVVLPDQYYDRTKNSQGHTFFGNGIVAHVPFAHPGCAEFRNLVWKCACRTANDLPRGRRVRIQNGGTYVNMEGPAFSTRAESQVNKKLGFDVIGMTSLAEAKLCREAGICYQSMAMVTDYDCWHENKRPVTVAMVLENLSANTEFARSVIKYLVPLASRTKKRCGCDQALANSIVTDPAMIPAGRKKALNLIIGGHL